MMLKDADFLERREKRLYKRVVPARAIAPREFATR
jgi:hypothetical protein